MLEDVLIIKQKHRVASKAIFRGLSKKLKPGQIIAISGESGSGKSELSNILAKLLKANGFKPKVIHTDDFYETIPNERNAIRIEKGIPDYVGINEYDWDNIYNVIAAFLNGSEITMPCVDLITNKVDKLHTHFAGIDLLILDGLYAIAAKNADYKVFIDLTYHETKKAQTHRGKESLDTIRFQVLEAEHKAVSSLKKDANFIINKEYKVRIVE
jgi:uridine kinase